MGRLREISKSVLVGLLESNDFIEYCGRIAVGSEVRLYYRVAGVEPYVYELIYVVE